MRPTNRKGWKKKPGNNTRTMSFVYRRIFNIVKGIIPKISDTEIIALKSGGVSIDRELFSGNVDYTKLYAPLPVSTQFSSGTLGLHQSVDGREKLHVQNPANHPEHEIDEIAELRRTTGTITDTEIIIPQRVQDAFDTKVIETPYLLVDLEVVASNYKRLLAAMPDACHYYAIKANPDRGVLTTLANLGCSFEVASTHEIDMCLLAGADPSKILYGNPLKKEREIAYAHSVGISQFVFDALSDLEKLSRAAPGARVICRISTEGRGAIFPLTIKFGTLRHHAEQWLKSAASLGLVPFGVSFHVGSQQLNPESWEKPMMEVGKIFAALEAHGHPLKVVDVGGGFPVRYRRDVPSIDRFGAAIASYAERFFDKPPLLYTEPGRYMTGDAGFILSEVVKISSDHGDPDLRWVYLDIGKYGGLTEDRIDYPVISKKSGNTGRVVLAGQTCDSRDVIYPEWFNYQLPRTLTEGDKLVLAYTGAYTTTYSTTLNGFPSLKSFSIASTLQATGVDTTQELTQCLYPREFLEQCSFTYPEMEQFPNTFSVRLFDLGKYGMGLMAMRDFERGEVVGAFTGTTSTKNLLHTLQVEPGVYIHDPHFIGNLLHSCAPNCALDMQGRKLYCIKDTKDGGRLTVDYAATEDVLSRQFACFCEAAHCRLWVTGRAEPVSQSGRTYLTDFQAKPGLPGLIRA
jgi:ornithine decarboxylase